MRSVGTVKVEGAKLNLTSKKWGEGGERLGCLDLVKQKDLWIFVHKSLIFYGAQGGI